jgi:hypothetical protein
MDQYNCVHHLCVTRSGVSSEVSKLLNDKLSKAELAAVFSINSLSFYIFYVLFFFYVIFIVKR